MANTTNMMDYGDDNASVHLQGELLGTMLDLIVRDATDSRHTLDDVMRLMMERYSGRTGYTSGDVESAVDTTCACGAHAFFEQYVRSAHPIDFNRYLALIGLHSEIANVQSVGHDGKPVADLRVSAWLSEGAARPRLRVFDRASVWARAGLHTGDTLLSVNGAAISSVAAFRAVVGSLKPGDSVTVVAAGVNGDRSIAVVVPQLVEPVATIGLMAGATERQRRLRDQWLAGH